jgi:hypothetical protein
MFFRSYKLNFLKKKVKEYETNAQMNATKLGLLNQQSRDMDEKMRQLNELLKAMRKQVESQEKQGMQPQLGVGASSVVRKARSVERSQRSVTCVKMAGLDDSRGK